MGLPDYIPTRTVGFRGALELEQGKSLTARVSVRSDTSLRWADDERPLLEAIGGSFTSAAGQAVTFPLAVTDSDGYLTVDNEIIDVSADGAYTHRYTATVQLMNAKGERVGDTLTFGPFVVPTAESTLWLDELAESTTVSGERVARPTVYRVNNQDGDVTITAAGIGAYVKPGTGVPASDLAAAVQTSLGLADTAVQPADVGTMAAQDAGDYLTAAETNAAYVGKPATRKAFQTLAAPNSSSATAAFDYAYRTMLKLPVATSRWRIGFSNRNLRSATIPTAPVTITGVFVGEPVFSTAWADGARWKGACTDALTQVSEDLTVPTDGTFVWSDWITDEADQFAPLVEKVIGWGHSNPASGSGIGYGNSIQYYRAAGNGNAGNATLAGATLTLQSLGDIVIEYEFAGPSQIGLFIGDSNTIGYTPSAPQLFPSAGEGALAHENWPGVAAELGGFVAVNIAVGSALPVDFASALPYLWTRVDLESVEIDFAVVSLGTNGLAGGDANFALFASYVLAINAQLRALGIERIFWTDIPPRSLTSGYSTVAVAASAAATTIQVASTLTLDSTNTLLIGSGPNAEIVTVSSGPTGSGPYTYTISALANAHAVGEHVTSSTETARRRQNIWLRNLPDGISGIIPFEVALEASPGSPNADPRYIASDLLHFQRGAGSLRAATAALSGVQPKLE